MTGLWELLTGSCEDSVKREWLFLDDSSVGRRALCAEPVSANAPCLEC